MEICKKNVSGLAYTELHIFNATNNYIFIYIYQKKSIYAYITCCVNNVLFNHGKKNSFLKKFSKNILLLNAFHDLNYNIYYRLYLSI